MLLECIISCLIVLLICGWWAHTKVVDVRCVYDDKYELVNENHCGLYLYQVKIKYTYLGIFKQWSETKKKLFESETSKDNWKNKQLRL
jgi:hypothetical protein